MNLQDTMLEIFGVDQKSRLSNFRLCSQINPSIVALLGGMERRKQVLERTRKKTPHFPVISG